MMAVSVSPERRAFGKETLPMLSTYYQSPSGPVSNSLPLKLFQLNDSNAIFIDHNCDGSHARTSHSDRQFGAAIHLTRAVAVMRTNC